MASPVDSWKEIRRSAVVSRYRILPLCTASERPYPASSGSEALEDISSSLFDVQENRALSSLRNLIAGMDGVDIRIVTDTNGRTTLVVNPSFGLTIRNNIEMCRRSLLYIHDIHVRCHEIRRDPESPRFSSCVVEVLYPYIEEIAYLSCSPVRLLEMIYEIESHQDRLKEAADLLKLIIKPDVTAKMVMDSISDALRKTVLPKVIEMLREVQSRTRALFLTYVLRWITEGILVVDPCLEFMIWPLNRLGKYFESKNTDPNNDIIISDGYIALRDMCPIEWLPLFAQILSAGKYVRMLESEKVHVQRKIASASELATRSLPQCLKEIGGMCKHVSGQLLTHMEKVYHIGDVFDAMNSVFLGTGTAITMLLDICHNDLLRPTDEVSLKTLNRVLNNCKHKLMELQILDVRIEVDHTTFFIVAGSHQHFDSGDSKPVFLSSFSLGWNPGHVLGQVWTQKVRYSYSTIQRFLFTIHAMRIRLESRIFLSQRQHCKFESLRRNMVIIREMYMFITSLLTHATQAIETETIECRKALLTADSVEEMCDILDVRLLSPLQGALFFSNADAMTHVEKAVDAIHCYLEYQEEDDLSGAYNVFGEARGVVLNHMGTNATIHK